MKEHGNKGNTYGQIDDEPRKERIVLMVTPTLYKRIAKAVGKNNSRNEYIVRLLEKELP